MSSSIPSSHQPFHQHRKIVAWAALSVVAAGSIFLMTSIGVSIARQRNATVGTPISESFTQYEIHSCHDELNDISLALEKHLESSYHLLRGYDSDEAQRWSDEGEVWRRRWKVLGERCRFSSHHPPLPQKDMEIMATVFQELGSMQSVYSEELLRFGKVLAPKLDRLKKRLDQLGDRLLAMPTPAGDAP